MQKSFKERVKETVIQTAPLYKKYYVEYEYLLCSTAFIKNKYYIVSAYEDNYLHLTGLNTKLNASVFFEKCYNGTLEESDFDFCKSGQSESEVKGSVRRKINILHEIVNIFEYSTLVEEDFEKNKIKCSLAAGNIKVTLGFIVVGKARPMTLLKGCELNPTKSKCLDLVLRRKKGENKFSEIVLGNSENLLNYQTCLDDLLSEELQLIQIDDI